MANVPSLSVVRDQARPKKLGRYELEECLGVEGNRETYRGRVRGLAGFDRFFAVKCLRRQPGVQISRTDPFVLTAKRLTTVNDARVARMLDADVVDGVAIAVSEFVHGLDLDRFREWAQVSGELATGADPAAQKWQKLVAYIGTEIAGGLAALHALSPPFVHGGLSPRNVVVTTRGGIKLLDVGLGIAAQKSGDPLSPRALAYAAPIAPDAEPAAAGDVRALGAMLFELGIGELPPPGMTSAEAKSVLDPLWPGMAEIIASMLAEDAGQRPRAAKAAEQFSHHWADVPDASMVTEVAALVRNFSAFVADAAATGGPVSPSPESPQVSVPTDRAPAGASGLLSMPPSPPSSVSGTFLIANEPTRVNPDEGYASAMFRSAPSDAPPSPGAPELPALRSAAPPVRATMGAGLGRGVGAKAAGAGAAPEGISPKSNESRSALPVKSAASPIKSAAPPVSARTLIMSPTLAAPPPAAPSMPRPTSALSAPLGSPSPASPPSKPPLPPPVPPIRPSPMPAAPSSVMPPAAPTPPRPLPPVLSPFPVTLSPPLSPAMPSVPSPFPSTLPPPLGMSASSSKASLAGRAPAHSAELTPEPEAVAEVADWGAQALVALGTQAGVPISLAPAGATASDVGLSGFDPPLTDEPSAGEAFAFAPLSGPQEQWLAPQPASQASVRAPTEVMEFAPPPNRESLEDQLVEDEHDPGHDAAGLESDLVSQPDAVFMEIAPPPEEPTEDYGSQRQAPALEATAFEMEEDAGGEQVTSRMAQEMPSSDASPSPSSRSRSALKSATGESGDLGAESWRPGMSRGKKIAIIAVAAVALAAGAASLVVFLTAKPPSQSLPTLQKSVAKKTPPGLPSAKPPAVAAEKPAAASKTTPTAATSAKTAPAEKPAPGQKPALAEKPAAVEKSAAGGKPAPIEPSKTSGATSKPAPPVAVAPAVAKVKEAAEPKLPAAPLAGGSIRVRVTSQPAGAAVWINGEERGTTPCTVDLKQGTARVVLVRAGHLTSQSTVEVREGVKIDETLKPVEPPMTGDARFRAECKSQGKLPIVVDGKETGILCPFSKMRVEPGTHNIGLLIPATGKVHSKEVILFAGVRSVVFAD